MKTVSVQEAEGDLAALIEAVERGETVVIERDEQPVARIVPAAAADADVPAASARSVEEVLEAMRRFRREHPLDGVTIRELIDEGRRP